MEQFLRKIIKEQLEEISYELYFDCQLIAKKIKKELLYVKELKFKTFKEINGDKIWFFTGNIVSYKIKFYIINDSKNLWKAKILVYWKKASPGLTSAEGKDTEKNFGPFRNVEELILTLNRQLHNNPLLGTHIYHDDWNQNMDDQAVDLLKKLKEIGEKIENSKHNNFEYLRNVHKDIKHLSDSDLDSYVKKIAKEEGDKQVFILHLQKMHKLDFYEAMHALGLHVPSSMKK